MKPARPLLPALLAGAASLPAAAHVTTGGTPHWHAGDAVAIAVVVALTVVAAWIDRRGR